MQRETTIGTGQGIYLGQRLPGEPDESGWLAERFSRLVEAGLPMSRQAIIGSLMVLALLAFELFNFDTTQFALRDLLGDVSFVGLGWATILAIAFCAIDFAGLVHLFTPEKGLEEPKEVWYLMGAWLLGATMNALMTWWAVSLTLLSHDFGNEILSRAQLLQFAPIFVAVLVWLTRILFIGAFSVAGEHLFQPAGRGIAPGAAARPALAAYDRPVAEPMPAPAPIIEEELTYEDLYEPAIAEPVPVQPTRPRMQPNQNPRIRQRPPRPGMGRPMTVGVMARGRRG